MLFLECQRCNSWTSWMFCCSFKTIWWVLGIVWPLAVLTSCRFFANLPQEKRDSLLPPEAKCKTYAKSMGQISRARPASRLHRHPGHYTTCPQRFPGFIRPHLVITHRSSAAIWYKPLAAIPEPPVKLCAKCGHISERSAERLVPVGRCVQAFEGHWMSRLAASIVGPKLSRRKRLITVNRSNCKGLASKGTHRRL